jgi:prefoldin subunit 5
MPENINIEREQHNITISEPMHDYHLPIASETVLGGIKVGNNLTIEEDGTLNAESTEYTLPTASASTLGGVKVGNNLAINDGVLTAAVDSVLSGSSTNPVQNSVVTSNISSINSDLGQLDTRTDNIENSVSTLSSTVTSQGTAITGLGNDISTLQTAVETNTNNIGTNTGNITANAQAISDLDDRLDTAEDNITNQGNAINELAGEINDFTLESATYVEYSYLLPVNTWSTGAITYSRRGKTALIQFNLSGTYDLQSGVDSQIYQLPATFQNAVDCSGVLITNDGCIEVKLDTDRNIIFYNHDSQTKHISKVKGQLTVVLD